MCRSISNAYDALSYLLDNIYISFGTRSLRQIVGIPMGINCAALVADMFGTVCSHVNDLNA